MAKRGGFPGGMGGFGGMNINNLMKEAKKMQAEMQKSQEELATKEFDSTAGGGAVSVKVTGEKVIKEITEPKEEVSYEEENEDFAKLIDTYTGYRDDDSLKELILKIYNYSQSMPFPEEWIKENVKKFNLGDKLEQDFAKTLWGEILVDFFYDEIKSCINELEKVSINLKKEIDLERYYGVILNDIENLKCLIKQNQTWDDIYINLNNIKHNFHKHQY